MEQKYREFLFDNGFFVADEKADHQNSWETLFALASLFNIRITGGYDLADLSMVRLASKKLGEDVPEPFYRGFPKSVRELSSDVLLLDQFVHYVKTYGLNMFEEAGHSVFERLTERVAFKEKTPVKDFAILTEEEALKKIEGIVNNLLQSSRPLNDAQYELVLNCVKEYHPAITNIASKNTAIRLLADSRDLSFLRFISLSDVIKLADEVNYRVYQNEDLKKLNWKNQDRKFVTKVIDGLFEAGKTDVVTCFEKKDLWKGLLHHLHYKPRCEAAEQFVKEMRGKENRSVWSEFEKEMTQRDPVKAAEVLQKGKGSGAVLRSLDYLISRCSNEEEIRQILGNLESRNVVVLYQLLLRYAQKQEPGEARSFIFTRYNKMRTHCESEKEVKARGTNLEEEETAQASAVIEKLLKDALKDRLGKVYIDPAMKKIALPLQENTAQAGYGVLPKGSRLPLQEGKKIRAFTYWEKVNDIDLSVIGITDQGFQREFSWRTMAGQQSAALVFSGDQTSGFNGGSEYFDFDLDEFKKLYPDTRYMVFCNNVYSGTHFSQCFCKAGYMVRDLEDSGAVFEPKTVQSSYLINCESTYAYLFGLDLRANEFVWLNAARGSDYIVAGNEDVSHLQRYFSTTDTVNMESFFTMMAKEVTDDPACADVIVSDRTEDQLQGKEVIRSCDFDKVLALMNQK